MTIGTQVEIVAVRIFIDFPLAVVGDEEVKQAVIVVVDPGGRHGPHFFAIKKPPPTLALSVTSVKVPFPLLCSN